MIDGAGLENINSWSALLQETLDAKQAELLARSPGFLGNLHEVQAICLGCLGSILSRQARDLDGATAARWRASVHASVAQGVKLIEYAIANGSYVQAAALVRQEIEAVEVVRGVRQGRQECRTNPRLKALKHMGRSYGQLTGLAHLTDRELLEHLASDGGGSIDPRLIEGFARHLFCIHLAALVGVALDAAELRPFSEQSCLSAQEEDWLAICCGVLSEAGFLKVPDAEPQTDGCRRDS